MNSWKKAREGSGQRRARECGRPRRRRATRGRERRIVRRRSAIGASRGGGATGGEVRREVRARARTWRILFIFFALTFFIFFPRGFPGPAAARTTTGPTGRVAMDSPRAGREATRGAGPASRGATAPTNDSIDIVRVMESPLLSLHAGRARSTAESTPSTPQLTWARSSARSPRRRISRRSEHPGAADPESDRVYATVGDSRLIAIRNLRRPQSRAETRKPELSRPLFALERRDDRRWLTLLAVGRGLGTTRRAATKGAVVREDVS